MADELEDNLNQPSEAEKRIKQLSGKVKEEAEAKDAALQAQADAEAKTAQAERRAAFAEGFVDVVSATPEAKEHKADIEAKVMAGYTVQDATYAVLGAAGKLGQQTETSSPAGGSAVITPPSGEKAVGEMTQAERRQALTETFG
jgi:hypothetical protein